MGQVEMKVQQQVANGRFGYPVQQQRLGMASAKAKKKRNMRRKLAKKKKKLKLTEPLKEAEREASMLRQLRLAIAKFDNNCSQGKVVLQDEMGLSTDGKAAKFLREGRSSRQSGDPTTSDVGASQFRANQFRKTSANSDTPRVEQQPERCFGMRAPPLQKPYSANVPGPVKAVVFSPLPLWSVNLPRPASSPAPTPASRQLITYKPQVLPPMPGNWLTIVRVAWSIPLNQFTQAPSNHFPPVNFPPIGKFSRNSPKPTVYYYHSVTVQCPPGLRPQPVAERPSTAPPQPGPGSPLQTEQAVCNQSTESADKLKTENSRKSEPVRWGAWKEDLRNLPQLALQTSRRRTSLVYGGPYSDDEAVEADMNVAGQRDYDSDPGPSTNWWHYRPHSQTKQKRKNEGSKNPRSQTLRKRVAETFSASAEHKPKNQVFSSAVLVDNANNMIQGVAAISDGSATSGLFEPLKHSGIASTPVSEGTLIISW